MIESADRKLAAHQTLYAALGDAERDEQPGLAALDAFLAENKWRWKPSPTAFSNWDQYAAALKAWLKGQACNRAAE